MFQAHLRSVRDAVPVQGVQELERAVGTSLSMEEDV